MNDIWVLDASAILALLGEEPGTDLVKSALYDGAVISAVNFCEVVGKLAETGLDSGEAQEVLGGLGLDIMDFDEHQALEAGLLRAKTKDLGLSLGDCACLFLAMSLGSTAVTADHSWDKTGLPVKIQLLR